MNNNIQEIINPQWKKDNIVLYCEDCFKIFPFVQNGSIDMILADLPYGTTACKWDSVLPLSELWKE